MAHGKSEDRRPSRAAMLRQQTKRARMLPAYAKAMAGKLTRLPKRRHGVRSNSGIVFIKGAHRPRLTA
jgi:hypothetical protein